METIADYVSRFVPFIPTLSAITIDVAVNTYFLPFYLKGGQGEFAIVGQFRGIDCVQDVIAKKPGLAEMVQNIYQKVYLLNKGEGASKLAELGMVDHVFLVQWQTDKDSVLFTIQPNILFSAKLPVADLRVQYRLEQFSTKKIIGKYITHGRAIPLIGQETIDNSIVKQLVNKLQLFVLDVYGRPLVIAQLCYSAFVYRINKLSHFIKLDDTFGRQLLLDVQKSFPRSGYSLVEIILGNKFHQYLLNNLVFSLFGQGDSSLGIAFSVVFG